MFGRILDAKQQPNDGTAKLPNVVEQPVSIEQANGEAVRRIQAGTAVLADMALARDAIPALGGRGRAVLHAGPPVAWEHMCGPMRGAVIGACLFEGWAGSPEEALRLAASGGLHFAPCHDHGAVGPMAGIVTPSMPVFIVRNEAFGTQAVATINMGQGKVLRMGAYADSVVTRLRWMAAVLYPVLRDAVRTAGGLDVKALMAQAVQMGDECHNRNKAATSLLLRALGPHLARAAGSLPDLPDVLRFMGHSDSFFLNIAMAACKAMLEPANGIPGCTLVTAMARNGTEFGIRVAGLPGRWFTAPAPKVRGVYFPGYTDADANPDIGDSAITETAGLGGFALAAAPAIVQLVGGTPEDALATTLRMYDVTAAEHEMFRIPALGFRGAPLGVDVRKVIETGIEPAIDTGIAHREAGVGQIGAGMTAAPMECFVKALEAFTAGVGGREKFGTRDPRFWT